MLLILSLVNYPDLLDCTSQSMHLRSTKFAYPGASSGLHACVSCSKDENCILLLYCPKSILPCKQRDLAVRARGIARRTPMRKSHHNDP